MTASSPTSTHQDAAIMLSTENTTTAVRDPAAVAGAEDMEVKMQYLEKEVKKLQHRLQIPTKTWVG